MNNVVSYFTINGNKCKQYDQVTYASRAFEGDNITMVIDLRPFKKRVSYTKNGLPLGIAFGGLGDWGDNVYIMFGIHYVNHRLKIVEYEVEE